MSSKALAIIEGEKQEKKDVMRQIKDFKVLKAWLTGATPVDISVQLNLPISTVKDAITRARTELREIYEDDIKNLAAERAEGVRGVIRRIEHILNNNEAVDGVPALLSTRLRAEETLARIQGVYQDKSSRLGKISLTQKVYTFKNNYPEMTESTIEIHPDMPDVVEGVITEPVVELPGQNVWEIVE